MNDQLARLIADYQTSVREAVTLMYCSGIQLPFSSADWIEADIPYSGKLKGDIEYFKHGVGCRVKLKTGTVDFDFGRQGEICGFDVWRLTRFANNRLVEYGFESADIVQHCFDAEVRLGRLVQSGCCLYYVANATRVFAVELDCRLPGDMLPHRDHDPVLALYAHHFLAADLMRENYEKLKAKRTREGRLSQRNEFNLGIYLSYWLGSLRVVCEGFEKPRIRLVLQENRPEEFKELVPMSDSIVKMMKAHSDPLRDFRNDVFHPRKNLNAIRQFFSGNAERLSWALALHSAIGEFFSEYRILCEVHYAIYERRGDMTIRRSARRKTKSSASK